MSAVCGCCESGAPVTPLAVTNRPALSAIVYRVGTYASFREAMLARIAGAPELAGLTTRRSDDYGITLLELWAAVGDVLTFYQERYANEAYLRTATFRESVARLAALIDYRPRPAVAAQASIAFTLQAGARLTIPAGQSVQSVPGEGEQPQAFETVEALEADARLNRLRVYPAPVSETPLQAGSTTATLDRLTGPALAAGLAPGDLVLLFADGGTAAPEEKKVAAVRTVDDRAVVSWTAPVQKATWNASTVAIKFRRTLRLFGHNAPEKYMEPEAPAGEPSRITWNLRTLPASALSLPERGHLLLDGRYEDLAVGQQLVVADGGSGGRKRLVTIQAVSQVQATVGPLTDTVTRVDVTPNVPAIANLRNVVVYEAVGRPLAFWAGRYADTLGGDAVYLPGVAVEDEEGPGIEVGRTVERGAFKPGVVLRAADLPRGRTVLIEDAAGEVVRAVVSAAPAIEPAGAAPGTFCHLRVPLDAETPLVQRTDTAVLLGNVAAATHGETVANEVVGSANGAAPFQRFTLKKTPLTFLPGTGADGVASTLDLRVGGVRWQEVPGLFGRPPAAPVYELRLAEDGRSVVQFGDGVMGAIPPTGQGNVVATYRVGAGRAGRVRAGTLTTLLRKPTTLLEATNPLPAEGGADAETLEDARAAAPRTVRTFGRIVSLRDFEDLVTASGEVAKALATPVWDGVDRAIHLTIAGDAGGTFSEAARRDLGDRLRLQRDPNHRLLIDNYGVVHFELRAGVGIDPAYDRDAVLEAVHAAVVDAYAFENLALGESVHLSDVYRVIQDVAGVVFVDVDRLLFKRPAEMSTPAWLAFLAARSASFLPGGAPAPVQARLRVFGARPDPDRPGRVLPAELAAIEAPAEDIIIEPRD